MLFLFSQGIFQGAAKAAQSPHLLARHIRAWSWGSPMSCRKPGGEDSFERLKWVADYCRSRVGATE